MPKLKLDKNLLKVICAGIILALLYHFFSDKLPLLTSLSLKTEDLFTRISYRLKPKPEELKNIVVIAIDDDSFIKLDRKWPWPRSLIAEFLENLREYKPKIIAMDLLFIGESQDKNDDLILEQSIKNAGNVIISDYISPDGSYKKPLAPFRNAALGFGFINKPRDKDKIVRSARLLFPRKEDSSILDLSFGLKSALRFLEVKIKDVSLEKHGLNIRLPEGKTAIGKLKQLKIPLSQSATAKLNFQAKKEDFKVVPFYKIIKREVAKEEIQEKLVAVGVTAEIFHDIYQAPLGLMPGVVVNANEILMYLSGKFINKAPDILEFLLILIVALVSAFFSYKLTVLKGFITLLGEIIVITGLCVATRYNNLSFDYFGLFFIASFLYLGTQTYKYLRLLVEATILKTMAITDGLTGLYVHRYLILKLDSEFTHAKEENSDLAFLIMDIDHFKKINDTYGHEEGNTILKNVARVIQGNSRRVDVVARYGGEEFCAILPNTTEKGANIYAERVRKTIEEFNFPYKENQTLKVTISIGIVCLSQANAENAKELIAFADKALYEAKETGRNKVCVFVPPETPPPK